MAKDYLLASISDQEKIIETLINLIADFPDMPPSVKKIMFYDMLPSNECIGIATTRSAIVFKKYINGDYIGQYRFRMDYRYATKNPDERIQKQSLLSTISEWLSKKPIQRLDGTTYSISEYPEISDVISISSIEIVDRAILVDKNKSGFEDSIIDLVLKYYRKEVI